MQIAQDKKGACNRDVLMKVKNTLETIAHKRELTPFWAEYTILRGPVGLMAFHGGSIEKGTEEMANYICSKTDCSLYVFSGRLSRDNYEKLHIPSSLLNPTHSEKLSSFMTHITTAIAFHGHRIDDLILVGGLNRSMRKKIVNALSEYDAKDAMEENDSSYKMVRGESTLNIVNKAREKGVQIEIPFRLRQLAGKQLSEEACNVGDCIARVLNTKD